VCTPAADAASLGTTAPVVLGARDRVDELLALVAADTVARAAVPDELGFCDAPSCGQFFTRPRSDARWCSTACGSRARVARHAARHTALHAARQTAPHAAPSEGQPAPGSASARGQPIRER
jgi:predicted RNA-binding Zn ribbon-like protein